MRLCDQEPTLLGRLSAPCQPSSTVQIGMVAGPSLLVNTATSLYISEAQLSGPGQVGTATGPAHLVLDSGHLVCMQREGVSSPQHLLSSHDSLAPISGPCGH